MNKIILAISFFFLITKAIAQQDPQYTQYMYNMNIVNPAYTTAKDSTMNFGVLYRSQWAGAIGAPKTATLFIHSPINEKIEVGFSLISDDIGDGVKKENNFYADFAYLLQFGNEHQLSLGLKAGFTSIRTNFNGFFLESGTPETDPAYSDNVNKLLPNIGFGAFYFTDMYYIGLSLPNLLSSKHIDKNSVISSLGSENIHAFFTGGYIFTLSDSFKLKPAFMTKFVKGAPVSADITGNILYNDKFEFGAAYRIGDAVSFLMNVNVLPSIRLGYAYDYTISNISKFNSGTHEFFVLFNLDFTKKEKEKTTKRFF